MIMSSLRVDITTLLSCPRYCYTLTTYYTEIFYVYYNDKFVSEISDILSKKMFHIYVITMI